MGDDERKAPNRTIQIDALTDVQLIENAAEGASVPPPLPRRATAAEPPPRSGARTLGLTLVAVIAGGAFAYLVMHVLMPQAPPAPPHPTVTPSTIATPVPAPATPDPEAPAAVHRVQIDEELVIHAADPSAPADPAAAP